MSIKERERKKETAHWSYKKRVSCTNSSKPSCSDCSNKAGRQVGRCFGLGVFVFVVVVVDVFVVLSSSLYIIPTTTHIRLDAIG